MKRQSQCKSVGIIGGGTAGYLTALSFRALCPDVQVTLIESSHIPIIGVGEATTSELIPYLHLLLGLDIQTLFREVKPTWKLGIRFEWGSRAEGYFNYPFDTGSVLEPLHHADDLRDVTQVSSLMTADKFPILRDGRDVRSMLWKLPFAYHLDNKPFVEYLKRRAIEAGVKHIDTEIVDAQLGVNGDEIESLRADSGRLFEFDLYVDCSGFRSFLLEKKLGSRFISYSSSLFTDSAVVASRPHDGLIRPYTTAETMDNGWCWNIPQVHEDHRGYVFSSAFCSVEQAAAEMRRKNQRMGDYWTVKFRSGRHEHFWKGNVVAIGNSYGFVEPLESTAIQVVLHENLALLKHLNEFGLEEKAKERLNRRVADDWDYIRWFLAVHYRFNQRLDTPFWKACRETVDYSGAEWIVQRFNERVPLIGSDLPKALTGPTFNSFGFDILLAGQSVPGVLGSPKETEAEFAIRRRTQRAITDVALLQRDALALLAERPDLLELDSADQSWPVKFARYLDYPERSMAE